MPNFDEISQSRAEIKLLRFRKTYGRHIGILFPVSILTCVSSSARHFTCAWQISY